MSGILSFVCEISGVLSWYRLAVQWADVVSFGLRRNALGACHEWGTQVSTHDRLAVRSKCHIVALAMGQPEPGHMSFVKCYSKQGCCSDFGYSG